MVNLRWLERAAAILTALTCHTLMDSFFWQSPVAEKLALTLNLSAQSQRNKKLLSDFSPQRRSLSFVHFQQIRSWKLSLSVGPEKRLTLKLREKVSWCLWTSSRCLCLQANRRRFCTRLPLEKPPIGPWKNCILALVTSLPSRCKAAPYSLNTGSGSK